jgi:hypothetical protein
LIAFADEVSSANPISPTTQNFHDDVSSSNRRVSDAVSDQDEISFPIAK